MSRTKEFSQREAMLPRAALGDSGLPPSTPASVLRKEGPGLTASEPGAVSDNTTSRSFSLYVSLRYNILALTLHLGKFLRFAQGHNPWASCWWNHLKASAHARAMD